MNKITESSIETFSIELLEKHVYQYIYGSDIATDSEREVFFSENYSGSNSPFSWSPAPLTPPSWSPAQLAPPLGGRGASGARQ